MRHHRRRTATQSVEELEYIAKVFFDRAFSFLDTARDVVSYLDDGLEDVDKLHQDPNAIGELRELANELSAHLSDAFDTSRNGLSALQQAQRLDPGARPDEHAAPMVGPRRSKTLRRRRKRMSS